MADRLDGDWRVGPRTVRRRLLKARLAGITECKEFARTSVPRWSQITIASAHWEQAFWPDGGATWETNWTMEFIRSRP